MDRFNIAIGSHPPALETGSLEDIIDKIRVLIPVDFNHLLIERLNRIKYSEQPWELLRRLLIEFIPRPHEEWQYQVLAIFSNKDIDLIKLFWQKEHPFEFVAWYEGMACMAKITGTVER